MFEAHVLHLLRRYLGEYVHGLSTEALQISVWKGDVVLKDLHLKAEALNALRLPIVVKAGFLGSVTLKVPWKSLGKEPVIVLIDRVFVLAEPKNTEFSSMEEDKQQLFEAKRRKIEEAELAMLDAKDKKKMKSENTQETNSWIGSLIATVVGNLKVSITNVHIRYEDTVSNLGHPFCAGIMLAKLAAVTTDENGKETFDTSGAWDKLCKSLQLERFAIYHDSDTIPWKLDKFWEELRADEWNEIFEAGIQEKSTKDVSKWSQGRQYLLHPVNGNLKYSRLGRQENHDPSVPSQKMSLIVNDVSLTVTENQYRDCIKWLEKVSRYRALVEVLHLRPIVSVSQNPRAWWFYAYQAYVHQQNKTGYTLSWKNVSHFCQLRRKYVQLYALILQEAPHIERKDLIEIENQFDAKVVLLWRLLAHARVESERSKELALERERARKSSWWSFGWGSTPASTDSSINSEDSPGASGMTSPGQLTKDEWKKLNEILGYDPSEDLLVLPENEPPNMLQMSIDAKIGQCAAHIVNDDNIEIICGKFESLQVELKSYPKSMHCTVNLMSYGISAPEGPLVQSIINKNEENALTTTFVYAPIGENLDWKLSATMASCHITVSMSSIERCLQFLKRNNSLSPEVASETATVLQMKLEKVTRRAQEHLQLALEEQNRFSLDIDVDAPKVRMPFDMMECSGNQSQLLVDFGHFTLRTMNENEIHTQSSSLYRRFYISGRDTAAFFVDGSFDWTNVPYIQPPLMYDEKFSQQSPDSTFKLMPILDKCGMFSIIDQIRVAHSGYPSLQVAIEVPNLGFHFSPTRYNRTLNLLKMFNEHESGKDKLGETTCSLGFTSWHPPDMEEDARVLFWGGIGNSVPEWKPCWLVLSGSHLYVFESKSSPTYQRCCRMNGKQVMEVPSLSLGGSEFCLAINNRGFDFQKALESTSTTIIQFKDESTKAKWLKSLVFATYRASAPMSMCIPGDSGDESEEEYPQPLEVSQMTTLFVIGSLLEMKLCIYGKVEDDSEAGDERILLELLAGGGKVHVTQQGGDLTIQMKVHTLMIEDKIQGCISRASKYLACSVVDDHNQDNNQDIFQEMGDACSPMKATNTWEEDEYFKDALNDFNCTEFISVNSGSSMPSTPKLRMNKLAMELEQANSDFGDLSDFVSVVFSTKQSDSPYYDGIDTQMLICMSKLDFFCNRSTVVALIDFGMELSQLMADAYSVSVCENAVEPDNGVVGNQGVNERAVVKGLLGTGKSRVVFQLKMNVDSVSIYLNKEDGSQLAMLVQEKFQMDLKVHPSSVSIEGLLGNLRICDMSNGPYHCWGWLCDIRETASDSLVKWKFQSFSRGDDDYEGYDYSLSGKLSAVRIVFLYRFVQEVLVYFYGLATPQAQQVTQVVDKVGGMEWLIQQSEIDGSSALKLDITLDSPIIVMPENSMSKNYIQLDLGYLKVSNKFEWHGGEGSEPSAIHLDVLSAQITDMNMAVAIDGVLGKPMMQEACGLYVTISRSLRDVFKRVPEVSIDIKINLLHGVMSDREYKIIIDCIFSNISEEASLVPSVRNTPGKPLNAPKDQENVVQKCQSGSQWESHKSNLEGSSYTLALWTVEVQFASLELYCGIDRESPLACMDIQGLWVAYRTSSMSEADLYVTLSKLSILDLRPTTKPEMRLMLGSVTDVETNVLRSDSEVKRESAMPQLTMLVVDWRVKQDSQALAVRMQQPRILVVLEFLLAVGEYFVPSLGAVTRREEMMDMQNDPLRLQNHRRLTAPFYEQKEEVLYLSCHQKLIADAFDIDEFTYDGSGHTIWLVGDDDSRRNTSKKMDPIIVIGYGKKLRMKNVCIKNASKLRQCIYLSSNSSFSASPDDGVIIDDSDIGNQKVDILKSGNRNAKEEYPMNVPKNASSNFIVEIQAVAPELTFYDSTKWSSDKNWRGEKLLRAKLDINIMYAAKEEDTWIRGLVKGLTVESGTGLAVLDPVDIYGEYSCVQEKSTVSVLTTDIFIHLSLGVLRLLIRLQDETAAALQFGSANVLSICNHFDKVWSDKQRNNDSQHITIWRPRPPSNYVILGDCITSGYVPPSQAVMAVSKTYGRVKKPLGFQLMWSFLGMGSAEGGSEISDEDVDCSLWMPIAPEGYTAMGCVAEIGRGPPSTSVVYCIRSDLITSASFSDCIYFISPDERYQKGFSIWRLENSFGSFFAHTSVNPPIRSLTCDLREMFRQHFNSGIYRGKDNIGHDLESNGSKHVIDSHLNASHSDGPSAIQKSGPYYMSTSQFRLIWLDKRSDQKQPVSIWRPIPPPGYFVIGDSIAEGLDPPSLGVVVRDDNSGRAEKPISFMKMHLCGKGLEDCFIWYPVAPAGCVSLGCIASKSECPPQLDSIRCTRMDLVYQTNISKKAVWPASPGKWSNNCSLWRVENQANTFIARPDMKRPPNRMAFGLVDFGKVKSHENLSGELKIGCLSMTVLENLAGMVTPLVDATLTNVNLAAHGSFEALNVVFVSSVAASTFNAQLEAWEPLLEPFDGIFKYEAYDSSNDSPFRLGKRLRITATNVVNVNVTSANAETLISLVLAWRKHLEHEEQAQLAADFEKENEDVRHQSTSALEEDNAEKLFVENKLGCDLYYKQYSDNFDAIKLLKPNDSAIVCLPPPRFPDRLNAVTETKAYRHYVAVHILEAKELMLTFNGIENNVFCALRLVTTKQGGDGGQKPFPQSARSRCIRPSVTERDNYLMGLVNWNEVFIFEVPQHGNTHLEVVITNLSAKAGKGEAVGKISVPIEKEPNNWLSQTCLPQAMQQASVKNARMFALQPLRKKGSSNFGNDTSNVGTISLSTLYLISRDHKAVEDDTEERIDVDEVGFKVAVNPGGPWASVRSILPLSTTLPYRLGEYFGLEVTRKQGQKQASLRSLVSVVNNTNIVLEICLCPLSLLRSPDIHSSIDSNKTSVVTEEVFENQCYNPLLGWGNKWPSFLMSTDPGRWSTNDYSASSKDFIQVPLPPGWKWTTDWYVDKSQFVDNEGWAYGPDLQGLKWPLKSLKSSKRSPVDFVRRRRWLRTRQRVSNINAKNRREVVAVLNPLCQSPLPWRPTEQRNDLCVQVRPHSESVGTNYSWGISTRYSARASGNTEKNMERCQTSKNFSSHSQSRTTASLFMLNKLEKTEEVIKCSPEHETTNYFWFSMEADANVLETQVSPLYDWKLSVSAPLMLENKLPCNAEYIIWEESNAGDKVFREHGLLLAGSSSYIYSVDIYKSVYLTWLAEGGWDHEKEEIFLLWDPSADSLPSYFWMRHEQSKRRLRISVERDFGQTHAAVKAVRFSVPYWVCNDTVLPVVFHLVEIEPSYSSDTDSFLLSRAIKAAKQASTQQSNKLQMEKSNVHKVVQTVEVLENFDGMPAMLSPQNHFYRSGFQSFSSREDENLLSPRLGIAATISKHAKYSYGISFCDLDRKERIDIKAFNMNGEYCRLSAFVDMASERTKVVHFQPHTLFANRTGQQIWLKQKGSHKHEYISPSDVPKTLLWDSSIQSELVKISLDGNIWSCPFSVRGGGIIHINFRCQMDYLPFYVKAEILNGTKSCRFLVVFQHVSALSPYRIENRSINLPLRIRQVGGDDGSWHLLHPLSSCPFAWEDLSRENLLEVLVNDSDLKKSFKYNIDVLGDHEPIDNENGPVQAPAVTVFKEGMANVIQISEWLPQNQSLDIVTTKTEASPSTYEQPLSAVEHGNQFDVIVELAEFGLSVVDHTPEELLYFFIQNLIMSYATDLGSGTRRFKLRLDGLQIDNQMPLTPMPVLFRPHGITNQLDFLLKFTMTMQDHGSTDSYMYPYVGIQGPISSNTVFTVKIHEPILWRLHEMFEKLNLSRLNASQTTDVAVDPIIRIGLLHVSEIRFKVSLAMSASQRPKGFFGFWSSLMTALSNTENMPIRIASRVHQNISMRQSAMLSAALSNIRRDLLSQPLQLLYGVDLLGNASSALGHMSKGIAALSMDKKFIQSRQRQEHKGNIEDLGDVIREGGGALAKGLFRGVTGILTKPLEGARTSGVEGFVQGVGKGIIGAAAQPMSGVLDLLSKTTEGAIAMRTKIAAAITSEEQSLRHRLPRAISGDHVLQPFDEYRAQGRALLQLAEHGSAFGQIDLFKVRGKFAFSDSYEDHFNLPKGRVVILTHRRIILLQRKNDSIKEPCTVVWDVPWDDILTVELKHGKGDPPGSAPSQLILILPPRLQDSKRSESKELNRVIKCHQGSRQAEEVCSAIKQVMNAYCSGSEIDKKKVKKPYGAMNTGAGAASGAALGMFTGFAAPITIPVMATFGALLGTAAGQAMLDGESDTFSAGDPRHGLRKDNERCSPVPTVNSSRATGKIINQLIPIWSDQRNQWAKNCHISFWRPLCPNGYVLVGDVLQCSHDPPKSVMVYANKPNGKFIHPSGFDLVWRSSDRSLGDPLTIWMPRAPPGYVTIGCVVVPDYYEPDPTVVYCVRKDYVENVSFGKSPVLRDHRDRDLWQCSFWQVQNDAHTFIARRDYNSPPQNLAFNVLT